MENRMWKWSLWSFFAMCCGAGGVLAFSSGPPPARTGDFGEANCTACHTGNALNAPGGTLVITGVPENYTPGQTYPITVTIQKPGQSRGGFEMAVRAVSSGQQAGTLAATDNRAQVVTSGGIQYAMHSVQGTSPGAASSSWTVSWTAPAAAVGAIRFGAAGNAANNSGTNQGDFIYTTTATTNARAETLPTTALFAQMAAGGGYSTAFTLMNTGTTAVNGHLILTGQDGAPFDATVQEPSPSLESPGPPPVLASTSALSIPPGGATTVTVNAPNAADPAKSGWARVESTGGTLSGVANFRLVSGGRLSTTVGVLSADTVDSATIPVSDDEPANRFTGYAVANPSASETVTIKIVMVREDGTAAATLSPVVLPPGQQTARFFVEDAAAAKTFRGTAVLIGQDGKKFSVVALIQDQGLFTAVPVTPGKASHIN